jgi:hypothetical protein
LLIRQWYLQTFNTQNYQHNISFTRLALIKDNSHTFDEDRSRSFAGIGFSSPHCSDLSGMFILPIINQLSQWAPSG